MSKKQPVAPTRVSLISAEHVPPLMRIKLGKKRIAAGLMVMGVGSEIHPAITINSRDPPYTTLGAQARYSTAITIHLGNRAPVDDDRARVSPRTESKTRRWTHEKTGSVAVRRWRRTRRGSVKAAAEA